MIENERDLRHAQALNVARQMMTAARTAPKGKGIDVIEIALVTDDDLSRLADEMRRIAEETGMKFQGHNLRKITSAHFSQHTPQHIGIIVRLV